MTGEERKHLQPRAIRATPKQLERLHRAVAACNSAMNKLGKPPIALDDFLVDTAHGYISVEDINPILERIGRIEKNSARIASVAGAQFNRDDFVKKLGEDASDKGAVRGHRGRRRDVWHTKGRRPQDA